MFANNNLGVMNMGFPDVCKTLVYVGVSATTIPLPYPNIAVSATHVPSQFTTIIGGGIAENIATSGTISNGDNVGILMGVASNTVMGPDRGVLGSFRTFYGCVPATRLTTINIQNSTNAPGVSLTPGQVRVILLG